MNNKAILSNLPVTILKNFSNKMKAHHKLENKTNKKSVKMTNKNLLMNKKYKNSFLMKIKEN